MLVRDLVVAGRLALDRLDLRTGERLLVTGENGAGKSTLLGVLAGRLAPTTGTVQVGARRVAELRPDVGFDDPQRGAEATYVAAVGEQVASHDRWLRRRWDGDVLPLRPGTLTR